MIKLLKGLFSDIRLDEVKIAKDLFYLKYWLTSSSNIKFSIDIDKFGQEIFDFLQYFAENVEKFYYLETMKIVFNNSLSEKDGEIFANIFNQIIDKAKIYQLTFTKIIFKFSDAIFILKKLQEQGREESNKIYFPCLLLNLPDYKMNRGFDEIPCYNNFDICNYLESLLLKYNFDCVFLPIINFCVKEITAYLKKISDSNITFINLFIKIKQENIFNPDFFQFTQTLCKENRKTFKLTYLICSNNEYIEDQIITPIKGIHFRLMSLNQFCTLRFILPNNSEYIDKVQSSLKLYLYCLKTKNLKKIKKFPITQLISDFLKPKLTFLNNTTNHN